MLGSSPVRILEHRALHGPSFWGRGAVILLRVATDDADLARRVLAAAVRLQRLAGLDVGEGSVWPERAPGVHILTYPFVEETTGMQAGLDAVETVAGGAADTDARVARLRLLAAQNRLGPSTRSVVEEAMRRGIPCLRLSGDHVQLGHGARQRRILNAITDRTSAIGVEIADDKERTKRILRAGGVPVPRGESVVTLRGAFEIADDLGWPVVVKPLVGNHGRGITTDVDTDERLEEAFDRAREVHPRVLVERHLRGHDYRVLVVGGRFVAAARREPAHVVGDGVRSVRALVDALNADPRRGEGHENVLTRVDLGEETLDMLARQGLAMDAVPEPGRVVVLRSTANLSAGGTATDVTDEVHPQVRAMCERVSRLIDLDIMGIDIVAPTLARPLDESGGGVVEVNASPGLRMHLHPSTGVPRDAAKAVVDLLFPPGHDGRIPIVAVTGTNGKTTTVRLLAHVLRAWGKRVGMASTGAVEIDGRVVLEGDYSGPAGAAAVLTEPTVDAAVVEVARGGILRRGLGFDRCDVGVLLNVTSDHLGEGGIDTLEDLARVKGVLLDAVAPAGTAVLNADNPLVLAQLPRLACRAILVSLDPDHEALRGHVSRGGSAVTIVDETIVLRGPGGARPLLAVRDAPITMDGRARFNVQNLLHAVAAAHAVGVPDETIARALATFNPTAAQLPGRLNILDVGKVRVVVDYGHNVAAVEALGQLLPHLAPGRRINVGHAAGNRRDEDLRALGAALARIYHHVILADPDPRGRPPLETPDLLRDGLRAAGFPDQNLVIVPDEGEAIEMALDMARDGDLVVLQVDDVGGALDRVRARQARLPPAPPRGPRTESARVT